MKYLGLILVLALVAGQVLASTINENDSPLIHSRVGRSLNDKFRNVLIRFKDVMRHGNENFPVPPMDPFISKEINIALVEEQVKVSAKLADVQVDGLSDYNIDKAKTAILSRKVHLGLTWTEIYAEGSYKLDINFPNGMRVFGEGDFIQAHNCKSAERTVDSPALVPHLSASRQMALRTRTSRLIANDLSFMSVIKIGIFGGLKIEEIETTIHLGRLTFEITGLYDDEESSKMISRGLSSMAPQLVEKYQVQLTDAVNKEAMEVINKKLEGKTISDIIAMLR